MYKKEAYEINMLSVCVSSLISAGRGSVNTFPQYRTIYGRIVFYAVSVVSKERQLIFFSRILFISISLITIDAKFTDL
jgi:hypothetical protein